jgi:hypothetical protein
MKRIKHHHSKPRGNARYVRIDAKTLIETTREDLTDDEIRNNFRIKVANSSPWIMSGYLERPVQVPTIQEL